MKLNINNENNKKNLKIICSKCGKRIEDDYNSPDTHNILNSLDSMCIHCNAFFCNECMSNKMDSKCFKCNEDYIISITYEQLNKIILN